MRPLALSRLATLALAAALASCAVPSTGYDLVEFRAAAAGPTDAVAGGSLAFTTDRGWDVVLTRAKLHVGAIYLAQAAPVSGAQGTSCVLPGTYVAEETSGRDVDLLDPTPQVFPAWAVGTTEPALAAQIWLTGGAIDAPDDATRILEVEGTAASAGVSFPFAGAITIGGNRRASGALPGASPICKQRIVSPIAVDVAVAASGGLLVRVDPRALFVNVDFGALPDVAGVRTFGDDPTATEYGQPSVNLYANLRSTGALWAFSWSPSL